MAGEDLTIHKAKDHSFKIVFDEPDLFISLLRNHVPIDLLKDITPADIEDMTERFIPLFQDNKDSDTVKKINLSGDLPLFVIAIVEHESKVNYRTSFKLLQYITLVLAEYEKEANKTSPGISSTKGFKYPPVLPIVFYDGMGKWTAETNFINRTELSDVFSKYIPKFEYELVSLNKYSIEDLTQFGDALSLIMIIDKIQTADGMSLLGKLPEDYINNLQLNIPAHLNEVLAKVITILLSRINVPKPEIAEITEKLYARRFQDMFTLIEKYDVQETRQIAKTGGKQEGRQEGRLDAAERLLRNGFKATVVAKILEIPYRKVLKIKKSIGKTGNGSAS